MLHIFVSGLFVLPWLFGCAHLKMENIRSGNMICLPIQLWPVNLWPKAKLYLKMHTSYQPQGNNPGAAESPLSILRQYNNFICQNKFLMLYITSVSTRKTRWNLWFKTLFKQYSGELQTLKHSFILKASSVLWHQTSATLIIVWYHTIYWYFCYRISGHWSSLTQYLVFSHCHFGSAGSIKSKEIRSHWSISYSESSAET